MMSTWCDAFETFHTVIAVIATTASTPTRCAVRRTSPRRGTSGRASTQSPAKTTTPPAKTAGRLYQPSTARSSPLDPDAATAAAAANTMTRSHCGSSWASNGRTLPDPRRPKMVMHNDCVRLDEIDLTDLDQFANGF